MRAIHFGTFQLSSLWAQGVCNAIASLCRNLVRLRRVRRSRSPHWNVSVVWVWGFCDIWIWCHGCIYKWDDLCCFHGDVVHFHHLSWHFWEGKHYHIHVCCQRERMVFWLLQSNGILLKMPIQWVLNLQNTSKKQLVLFPFLPVSGKNGGEPLRISYRNLIFSHGKNFLGGYPWVSAGPVTGEVSPGQGN